MAKKKSKTPSSQTNGHKPKLTPQDKKTLASLKSLADGVVQVAERSRPPHMDVPSRSLSNARYNKSKRYIEMGNNTTRRELFNLSQAKAYMQTLLIGSGCKQLIEQGKTTSIRGLFYLLKHTIEGTKEETFSDQSESDPIIEDVEVLLNALREELHVYASNRGTMAGNIVINDTGDEIDCSRFNEDKFWKEHNCILTHGMGQPPRGVRRLLHRLHNELGLPIYCVLDNDPWGYYIYSVIKQGSINLAFESKRMSIPDAKYLGLRSIDFERCGLSPSVQIRLNENDRKRAKQIAKYPWFEGKPKWQKEIKTLLDNDFKLEVEALINKGISFVTETYVPERLEEKDWLD
jgi:DNA topoisomerase-6 subunit A